MRRKFGTISVIGLGYIGLPTAAMFASRKVSVIGVDTDERAVEMINRGEVHIVEPDLDIVVQAAVQQGYLRATKASEPAEAFLIAVPTPFKGSQHEPDLSCIEAAVRSIAPVLAPGNLVVLESTSPVGTTERIAGWLADARPDLTFPQTHGEASDIRIAHCPERVLPGKVLHELIHNDRVIGGMSPRCSEVALSLYRTFVDGECVLTDPRTAEMAKLTENAYRDANIAFANELSLICDKLDIDVWELIRIANRHPRVGILQPGPGVGGHCIATDPWFIVSLTPEEATLIRTAREVNDAKPGWVVAKVEQAVAAHLSRNLKQDIEDVVIACYGLAFKPDIDDLRNSPAVEIAAMLTARHPGRILIVEPHVDTLSEALGGASLVTKDEARTRGHVHVMLVDHKEFKNGNPPEGELVDTRGAWRIQ